MGMAAIGIALYKYVMKYSPSNCNYFNRDRFVLSNGMVNPPSRRAAKTDETQAMLASGNICSCTLLESRA
jgi:transketolase-like protein